MSFIKYQHIERLGSEEVEGIELGTCYIFPKIDGTNGSVWMEGGKLKAASRRRELDAENDNQGFYNNIIQNKKIIHLLSDRPYLRLFGEWLVPHSLKTYKENAWRKFYIFDVAIDKTEDEIKHDGDDRIKYLHYDDYKNLLEEYGVDYIPPIAIIKNPRAEKFFDFLDKNTFLIEDGKGVGEGIVIKNYDFYNKYGRQTWAKIVTSEFKEKHTKVMGAPEMDGGEILEEEIVEEFLTLSTVEKIYNNIKNENGGWSSKYIPRLLQTTFYDLVKEESWNFIKKHKNPKIDFKVLYRFTINKVKQLKPELF